LTLFANSKGCHRVARKLRLQYPGAIYHVMNRGDRREPMFRDDKARELFLQTAGEACLKTDREVHSWCLMSNHFHLVIETNLRRQETQVAAPAADDGQSGSCGERMIPH